METDPEALYPLIEARGIGLLIGIERERSTGSPGKDATTGVRTFALASFICTISMIAGGVPLLMVAVAIVALARIASVARRADPDFLADADIGDRGTPERRIDALSDRKEDLSRLLQKALGEIVQRPVDHKGARTVLLKRRAHRVHDHRNREYTL